MKLLKGKAHEINNALLRFRRVLSLHALLRIQMDHVGLSSDCRIHFPSVCVNSCWSWFKSPARRQLVLTSFIACVWYTNLNPRADLQCMFFDWTPCAQIEQSCCEGKSAQTMPRLLPVIWFHATRLETRTKESNICGNLSMIENCRHCESKGYFAAEVRSPLNEERFINWLILLLERFWARAHQLGPKWWWSHAWVGRSQRKLKGKIDFDVP